MKRLLAFLALGFLAYLSLPLFASVDSVPDVVFTFQQPAYLTDKNPLLSEFTCDADHADCKINFDLSASFTGGFQSSDFTCLLDFGMASPTGEEVKCNPNTVTFTGSSDYTVRFRIAKKTDSTLFSERTLVVHSGRTLSSPTSSGSLSETGSLTETGTSSGTGISESSGALSETGFLVSTGNVLSITYTGATLSGVVFQPETWTGTVYYGTGELISTGRILSGSFVFPDLAADTDYGYRIGFASPSWSGEVLSETGFFRTSALPKLVPDIVFAFQQPAYLTDKNPLLSEFTCDADHADCKINFDLSASFTGGFRSSDFACLLDFGMASPTGEEAKCNPNTVTFTGSSDYTVRFRIVKKSDSALFSERTIAVHSGYVPPATSTDTTATGSVSGSGASESSGYPADSGSLADSWASSTGSALAIAEPEIVIQSGIDPAGKCTKTDCIINLQYVPKDPKESCHWDFPGGTYASGTENSCNPGYIHYPIGDFSVTLRVYERGNTGNFRDKVLSFSNSAPVVVSGGGTSSASASISLPAPISLLDPAITVQSGLDADRHCTKSDCAVNFTYKVLWPKEACHWDFPGGSYAAGTENKCNPGYVHYPLGEFSVTLRVYEQGNIFHYREKVLRFSNGTRTLVQKEKLSPENHPPHAAIKLQGTLGKTKKQQGNSVTCVESDECSINLSGEESYDLDRDKLTYAWDFWNGTLSDRENPAAVKYGKGEYSVILRVSDAKGLSGEDRFRVSVLGKDAKENMPEKPIDPNVFSLKLTGVSPNPLGNDGLSEWAEIANPLAVDISLAGCALDDEKGKGSDPYLFPDNAVIPANSKKRYYKLQTLLNFNNTWDSANLSCGGKAISLIAWDYAVPEGFTVSGKEWPYKERVRTKVLRTIDGDTIEIELYGKKEKVRLIWADTPETVDPRKKIQFFGKQASDYTRSRLEGREVELEFDFDPRDKYDRLLAYVWIDGTNFDLELVRLGYARAYLRFPFRYFKEFEKAGKEAEKNKIGMWADPEVKKILATETKEDKKILEKQLREEDVAILGDLMQVAKDTKIGSEKLDMQISDRIAAAEKKEAQTEDDVPGHGKAREVSEESGIGDIHISLQWKLSKNRTLAGNAFTCHTKATCSVNFTAGKSRKDIVYLWNFGNGETFSGANPKAQKFRFGNYTVTLRISDARTGSMREEGFSVTVKKLVTVKKKKVKKVPVPKVPQKKPLTVKWRDFLSPSALDSPKLPPLQTSTSAGVIVLALFSGVHLVVRKKGVGF